MRRELEEAKDRITRGIQLLGQALFLIKGGGRALERATVKYPTEVTISWIRKYLPGEPIPKKFTAFSFLEFARKILPDLEPLVGELHIRARRDPIFYEAYKSLELADIEVGQARSWIERTLVAPDAELYIRTSMDLLGHARDRVRGVIDFLFKVQLQSRP